MPVISAPASRAAVSSGPALSSAERSARRCWWSGIGSTPIAHGRPPPSSRRTRRTMRWPICRPMRRSSIPEEQCNALVKRAMANALPGSVADLHRLARREFGRLQASTRDDRQLLSPRRSLRCRPSVKIISPAYQLADPYNKAPHRSSHRQPPHADSCANFLGSELPLLPRPSRRNSVLLSECLFFEQKPASCTQVAQRLDCIVSLMGIVALAQGDQPQVSNIEVIHEAR